MQDGKSKSRNHRVRWTISELKFLEEHYGKIPRADIGKHLGRSASAIQGMANKIGCCTRRAAAWTETEKNILRATYETDMDSKLICAMLPGRALQSITVMARNMGLSRPESLWRQDEIDVLRTYYPVEGKKIAARLPDRGPEAVKLKANELSIKFQGDDLYRIWSEEEWALLTQNDFLPIARLRELFPQRSRASVSMARRRFRRNVKTSHRK
ncbi:TPA: hypothetical protein ACOEP6_004666 [Enterobacter ludwigii]